MDLSTRYLGLALHNPLVASASPLTSTVPGVRRLVDAGVAAVVLPSLFEEQVHREQLRDLQLVEAHEHAFSEAATYFPSPSPSPTQPGGAKRYVRLVERAVAAVDVPVIASLNGSTPGGWPLFAHAMQEAGAAAVELNITFVPGDPRTTGRQVEDRHVEILERVLENVSIPVAVKLGPQFSSPGELALRLDRTGARGLVLFNRFVQPDIDPEAMVVSPGFPLSTPTEAPLARTWIAVLHGHVGCSLAASTGVETAADVAAYLLAGADVVMSTSSLLRHGPEHASVLLDGLTDWLTRKGFAGVDEARGRLAVPRDVDASTYERAGYVAALEHARETYGGVPRT
ncbi:dihydroorotate dehydrogenase-like protein [Nocardioides sp. T5]|uniref:dihydroorotate dehydrogenase-like protein n=1 Tax=Nocardioides sp. T5 TaxID=3400182 RepID=UPI003A864E95